MSQEKKIEEMVCKNCIHYQMCVDTFRKGKQDGEYLLIEEDEYFAHANGCDFYADKRIYRKPSEGEWIHDMNNLYGCSNCLWRSAMSPKMMLPYCPRCGAKMKEGIEHEQERNAPGE